MKATLYDSKGTKKSQIELPALFTTPIREDIVAKYVEAYRREQMQPYGSYVEAGKRHSASGTISHRRHEWKGHYGKGISRLPRKVMWRRGTQFMWVGAEVASTRGGRRAHPPKVDRRQLKINTKERQIAFASAFAATVNAQSLLKRYAHIKNSSFTPSVIESLPSKAKEFHILIDALFASLSVSPFKQRSVRAGVGKSRSRKYKSSAGVIVITANDEHASCAGIDIKPVNQLEITDLYPLGRLALYTQKALKQIETFNREKSHA